MGDGLKKRCTDLVEELGLGAAVDVRNVVPLTGGVASDIAMVDLGDRKFCVKFALPKLKVAEDWQAPVHRNRAEYAWLKVAAEIAPDGAVRMFGQSVNQFGFAMEFLSGDDVTLWKAELLQGKIDLCEVARVGELLGKVHAASTNRGFDRAAFQNRDDFRALRIEPYLSFTASRHPEVADILNTLADQLYNADQVLVHGDVSPKNILFRSGVPVVLDAECATMGDPAFDVAFCLNHLVLKALHVPELRPVLAEAVHTFWSAYAEHVSWESADGLESRVSALLPALMLARADGKSPVEYLDEAGKNRVRQLALPLIHTPVATLGAFVRKLNL